MKYGELIEKMTLEEKASLCSGKNFWYLKSIERLGIPSVMVADGPHGLRKQDKEADHLGVGESVPATCFPLACLTAASWDRGMLQKLGEALGEEALQERVSVVLGPGANIKRSPLCGRNFEYFSEDPYLSGELAASFINGVQSKGIGTSLKHYAGNNQETRRQVIDSVIDERALREIYLTAFEIAVKKAQPWTVMNAYNKVNGTFCSENEHLLLEILKEEWGHEGLVVTDWGAENDRVPGLIAGQELEMPSSGGANDAKIVQAVQNGELDESLLDERVDRILHLIFRSQPVLEKEHTYDVEEHHALARKMAANSMVLMKNEDGILPLKADAPFALIGDMAKNPRYQGAGSSLINPNKLDTAFDTVKAEFGLEPPFAKGYESDTDKVDQKLIDEAVSLAKETETVILYVGLTSIYESEAYDRRHMRLPENQLRLIEAVTAVNDRVILLLSGGSPVEMPFLNGVRAVVNGYLGGQAGGSASLDVLFGKVNPSGKLPETYPIRYEDNPSALNFPGNPLTVEYRESVYCGYRYYDTAKKEVQFPFGFGLSYTTYEYSDLQVSADEIQDTDSVSVTFTVKNTGDVDGAEIAQVYVRDVESTIFRPEKELKEFRKVFLKAGEEKTVTVELSKRAFAYYNVEAGDWHAESGAYEILIGASSRDIRLTGSVTVQSTQELKAPDLRETLPAYYAADVEKMDAAAFETLLGRPLPKTHRAPDDPYDLNATLYDLEEATFAGRSVCRLIKIFARKSVPGDASMQAMMLSMLMETPIRALVLMSNGAFQEDMAYLLIRLCTGHFWSSLGKMIVRVPKLIKGLKQDVL